MKIVKRSREGRCRLSSVVLSVWAVSPAHACALLASSPHWTHHLFQMFVLAPCLYFHLTFMDVPPLDISSAVQPPVTYISRSCRSSFNVSHTVSRDVSTSHT
jgi:hypothetical protein